MARVSTDDRFWSKVNTASGPDACHPWLAQLGNNDYGIFWDGTYDDKGQGRKVKATRWAWARFIGPIPDGMYVCHTCDNPTCLNQRHLFLGTAADNNRDRDTKGRNGGHKTAGSANGSAKLTEQQVVAIRARASAGEKQRALASEFGVTQTLVSQIARRIIWRQVA